MRWSVLHCNVQDGETLPVLGGKESGMLNQKKKKNKITRLGQILQNNKGIICIFFFCGNTFLLLKLFYQFVKWDHLKIGTP